MFNVLYIKVIGNLYFYIDNINITEIACKVPII